MPATPPTTGRPDTTPTFFSTLAASGPAPEIGVTIPDLYGFLIGSWDAEVVDHLPEGDRRQSAELHFARVLEGRAVQDLWIAPAVPDRPATPAAGNRFGTTLRMFDPAIGAWRVTWMNPVTGVETRLVGRASNGDVVQTGSDTAGRLVRWIFDEIRPDRFHWRGDLSVDGGRAWHCEVEFFARRRQG